MPFFLLSLRYFEKDKFALPSKFFTPPYISEMPFLGGILMEKSLFFVFSLKKKMEER
jgi:hypothetical protein